MAGKSRDALYTFPLYNSRESKMMVFYHFLEVKAETKRDLSVLDLYFEKQISSGIPITKWMMSFVC